MAGKKKEDALTIEDRLKAALVPEDEQPYPIPENWVWTKMGTVTDINMGQSPAGIYTNTDSNGLPLVGGPTDMGDVYPTTGRYTSKPAKSCRDGDIIISVRATIGKLNIADREYCLGRGVAGIRGNGINQNFIKRYLQTCTQSLVERGTGTTFLQVSKRDISTLTFPLPPLPEQQRIAKHLESLLGKIKEAKALLDEVPEILQNFRQTVLASACSGRLTADWRREKFTMVSTPEEVGHHLGMVPADEQPYPVPEKWVWTRLDRAFNEVKDKTIPTQETNLSFIGLEHLKSGGGIIGIGNSKDVKSTKTVFNTGDVLYGKLRPYLNKHALVNFSGVASTDILVFRSKGILDPRLLDNYLGLLHVVAYAQSNSKGINLPRVSPQVIKSLPVPLPPLPEQHEIVRRVESLFNKSDNLEAQYKEAMGLIETLPEIILSKAFRGELVPQDPGDEPASVLLENIVATRGISENNSTNKIRKKVGII